MLQMHVSVPYVSVFLSLSLHAHFSSYFYTQILPHELSLPPTLSPSLTRSLSECRMFNSRLRVAGRVVSLSPVPTQAYCLHTGVMDSVAADTAHISLSCPVPWRWTIIARHRTAMVTPYMAQKEWLITRLRGNAFCFPMKFASLLSARHVKWLTDVRFSWEERRHWKYWYRLWISCHSGSVAALAAMSFSRWCV